MIPWLKGVSQQKLFSKSSVENNHLLIYLREFDLAGREKLVLTGPSPFQERGKPGSVKN